MEKTKHREELSSSRPTHLRRPRLPPSMISAVSWIPRGAVKRVPIKQELSADELAQVREAAAAEAAAEAAAGHRGEEEEGEEAAKGGAARQAVAAAAAAAALGGPKAARRTGRPDPLADPAFASLRGVQLPFDMDEDEDASASDSASSKEGGDDAPAGRQRRDAARARAQATLDRAVLGQRMADIDAPAAFDDEEEEPEDEEDLVAAPGDCFLLAATSEEEHSALEVHVYNVEDGSLYVHHDITLPALPLCLAWMDYAGSAAAAAASAQRALFSGGAPPTGGDETVGSYVAVGTFKPDIEIWNADVLDPLEPSLVLRGAGAGGAGGGAGGGRRGAPPRASALATATAPGSTAGHGDAVLGLSWNRAHRHLLASGSADSSVKVWDLDAARGAGGVLHTYTHHKGKVQSVAWNPAEASVLAAASYDRTLSVTDARAPDKSRIARYSLPSDPEALAWGAHNPAQLLVGCEDGALLSYDVRSPDTPLWHLPAAHTGALTCIAQSLLARGLIATGGLDKSVKLWDTLAAGAGAPAAPACIAGKVMSIGQIFSISFFPTSPFLLAAGGSKGMVAVWDIEADGGQPASGAASAPAPSSSSSSDAHLLGADASETARRFAGRMVTDPASVPGNPLAIRARVDGQAMA